MGNSFLCSWYLLDNPGSDLGMFEAQMKICPIHKTEMFAISTEYGTRYSCLQLGCDVQCWSGSTSTPANQHTRSMRYKAHRFFDPLWKGKGKKARSEAYKWLQEVMELSPEQCHIGMFTATECEKVVKLVLAKRMTCQKID